MKEARERWLHGNYGEAREQYEALAKDAKLRPAATIGLSRALESEGEYDKALEVVEAALKDMPKDANLLARHAELLYQRGRWDEAEKAANAAIDANKNQFLARWVRAQVHRDRGDMKKADAECKWFVRTYTQRDNNDDPIKDPEQLVLVGLAGAENARWNNLSDQFTFILQDVYGDAVKYDKTYWPAEYQAGMLLLEKYNRPEALAAFDKALDDQRQFRRGDRRQGRRRPDAASRSRRPSAWPSRRWASIRSCPKRCVCAPTSTWPPAMRPRR